MASSPADGGLSPQLEVQIGRQNADLLLGPVFWIVRRREAVEISDETSLRRQITVDFSLPETLPSGNRPVHFPDRGPCAPVLVLPKKPSNYMSFDLVDSTGETLPLAARQENARISAATIKAMAVAVVGHQPQHPSIDLAERLGEIALAKAADGEALVDELLSSDQARFGNGDLKGLALHPRFRWWLFTLAHSSIVMVPSQKELGRRTIVKLGFREPILHSMSWKTGFGWKPYSVHVDSSFIGARSFHFEAHSPTGLRIDGAALASDRPTVTHDGMLRRAHLYLPGAEEGGGATAVLALRVAGSGFVRDAWLASLLVTAAITACLIWAPNIVRNSSNGTPALLLLLPGLIATYLGRPDRHGLTQRLLAWTRRALMASALLAYVTAARVALSGPPPTEGEVCDEVHGLRSFLWVLLSLAALTSGILIVARIRSDHLVGLGRSKATGLLSRLSKLASENLEGRFSIEQELDGEPDQIAADVQLVTREICGPRGKLVFGDEARQDNWSFAIHEGRILSSLEIDVQLHPAREGTRVKCSGYSRGKGVAKALDPWRAMRTRRLSRKALKELASRLAKERHEVAGN